MHATRPESVLQKICYSQSPEFIPTPQHGFVSTADDEEAGHWYRMQRISLVQSVSVYSLRHKQRVRSSTDRHHGGANRSVGLAVNVRCCPYPIGRRLQYSGGMKVAPETESDDVIRNSRQHFRRRARLVTTTLGDVYVET